MSGPLARSAHMRMKMKREKNGPTTPRAPLSPAAVNKDLLLAAAVASTATLSSEVSEKEVEAVPQNNLPSRSLSSPVAVRSRSRSRSRPRVRGGINSLDTEGDYVVESASPAAPSPRTREVPLQRQSSPSNSFAKNSFGFDNVSSPRQQQPTLSGSVANNPISPTHPRSIFNSSSPRHFSARSRKSYDFPPSPSHQQFDVAEVQSLRNTQREQMENVRKYNEETVEMHDRRKEQLSPGSRVSVEEEAFDPFAPSPLTVPVEKEDFQDAFDDGFTSAVTPAPGGAGFHSSPHYSKSPQLIIDTQSPPYDNDPTADVYSPNHKDGSKMMTIEGHDDNFVYPESYEDHPDADLEYHTNDDEEPVNLNDSIDATIDSNGAVEGTPVRKKRKKKKKPKFMIENVHSADSFDKKRSTEGRYAIHNNSWEEDEENLEPRDVSKVRGHSVKYNKIAATAKRYEGMEDRREKVALSPIAGDGRKVVMPSRIGVSRSWDSSKVEEVPPVVSSKSWDAPSDNGSHGWRNVTKKQLNIWNDDYVEEGEVEKSPSRQKQFVGATKSWDVNGVQKNTEQSHGNRQDMNFFHADPFGHAPIEGNANVGVKDAFASWDGDGPEWKDPNEETEEVASDKATETNPKKEIDWNKKGTENIQNMIPAEFETPNVSEQVSDYEEDEDSIFAFEKKEEEIKETAPPPPPANPQDIFAKLNKGLKQAERNKSHALRGDASLSNAGSDFSKDASEPASETSKPAEKRNVAFAKDKDNTIHTYLVEESHFDSRDSASHVESTDDEVETDIESSVDKEEEENITTSPKNQVKISSPRSISSKNNTGSSNDGAAAPNVSASLLIEYSRHTVSSTQNMSLLHIGQQENQTTFKKKTVHYQSDEDTSYHTNEESTMGSSFKSNRSGVTPEQEEEKELNLLDHVAGLAASLGGLFTSPTNAAASKTDDDKSLSASTDQDDNTYGQSTLPSQDNTTQSDDWFGYMEKVLFPTNDEAYVRCPHSLFVLLVSCLHSMLDLHLISLFSLTQSDQFTQKVNTQKASTPQVITVKAKLVLRNIQWMIQMWTKMRRMMNIFCSRPWLRHEQFIIFMALNMTKHKKLMLLMMSSFMLPTLNFHSDVSALC